MAIMPGASRVQKFSGNTLRSPIDKFVIHTTEGSSWPGYANGGNAPHFTTHRDGSIRQHIDTKYAAKALVNKRGGVQTNNDGCVQVEYIGSCDRDYAKKHNLFFVEDATDKDLEPLAKVLAWAHETHGIPLTTRSLVWSDTNAAYESAPQRMSQSEWRDFSGVCGHQHVPENSHWDPGLMDVERVIELARRIVNKDNVVIGGGAAVPAPRPKSSGYKVISEDGRLGRKTGRALQRWLNKEHGAGLDEDGKIGDKTWRALQEALGTPVDGEVSNQSHSASSLGNGVTQGWDYDGPNADGSTMVRALQRLIGVRDDGIWGEKTTKALQAFLNDELT